MASETVPGVRANLARAAQHGAAKITGIVPLTPGMDSPRAGRAAMRWLSESG